MGGSSDKPFPQQSNEKKTTKQKQKQKTVNRVTAPGWVSNQWQDATAGYGGIADEFGNIPNQTQMGWDLAEGVALGQDPFDAFNVSQTALRDTARGDYLLGGQGFDAAVDAAFRAGMPGVLSAFGAGGRSDGGLAKVALAQQFADPFAAQYGQERQRQLQAAQLLPGMSLMPAAAMEGIGQGMDARQLQQANLYAGMPGLLSPWLEQQTKVTGRGRGTVQSDGTISPAYMPGDPIGEGIGGAIAGAGTGFMITGEPLGALAGGVLGGAGGAGVFG